MGPVQSFKRFSHLTGSLDDGSSLASVAEAAIAGPRVDLRSRLAVIHNGPTEPDLVGFVVIAAQVERFHQHPLGLLVVNPSVQLVPGVLRFVNVIYLSIKGRGGWNAGWLGTGTLARWTILTKPWASYLSDVMS